MPITKEQILQYILKLIEAKDEHLVRKVLDTFPENISKSSVYNYLNELERRGSIKKVDGRYLLVFRENRFCYENNGTLDEDRVFDRDIAGVLSHLPKNVFSAWRYAFTEMMNNAIEHSSATKITVSVLESAVKTTVIISDNGRGIFNNIKSYVMETTGEDITLKEAAAMLFAGKFTTARSAHSGEGIFFTSHTMDSFRILSDGIVFTRDNFNDTSSDDVEFDTESTTVVMQLDNASKKTLRQVFDRFSDVEEGFIKTQIPIAHIFSGAGPVSRSEARRLGELILKVREIDLDFTGVEEVGQAFVHELFIVWQGKNPDIKLNVLGAGDDVDFMIRRVKNTK